MKDMSAEEREMVEKFQGKGAAQIGTLIATPIAMFIYLFIAAALCLVLGKALGSLLSYGQALAIMAYAGLVALPQQVVGALLISAKKTAEIQMGLGLFLSEEAMQSFGGRFLAGIDPFSVWWTVIIGLGLSIVGNLDRSRAYIGAIVLSLIWIAGSAGFASLGTAFSPGGLGGNQEAPSAEGPRLLALGRLGRGCCLFQLAAGKGRRDISHGASRAGRGRR